jgi:hypothetical protein
MLFCAILESPLFKILVCIYTSPYAACPMGWMRVDDRKAEARVMHARATVLLEDYAANGNIAYEGIQTDVLSSLSGLLGTVEAECGSDNGQDAPTAVVPPRPQVR